MGSVQYKPKRRRFNGRLPDLLMGWVEKYAVKKNKSVTQVIVDQLQELKEREERRGKDR